MGFVSFRNATLSILVNSDVNKHSEPNLQKLESPKTTRSELEIRYSVSDPKIFEFSMITEMFADVIEEFEIMRTNLLLIPDADSLSVTGMEIFAPPTPIPAFSLLTYTV